MSFQTSFWSDPEVREWPALAQHLYLYLFTNEHVSGITGVGQLSLSTICLEARLSKSAFEKAKEILGEKVRWYPAGWYWVVGRLKHVCGGPQHNPRDSRIAGALRLLCELPPAMQADLWQKYPHLRPPHRGVDAPPPGPIPPVDALPTGQCPTSTSTVAVAVAVAVKRTEKTPPRKTPQGEVPGDNLDVSLPGQVVVYLNEEKATAQTKKILSQQIQKAVKNHGPACVRRALDELEAGIVAGRRPANIEKLPGYFAPILERRIQEADDEECARQRQEAEEKERVKRQMLVEGVDRAKKLKALSETVGKVRGTSESRQNAQEGSKQSAGGEKGGAMPVPGPSKAKTPQNA